MPLLTAALVGTGRGRELPRRMALVGFKARNHPQQVGLFGADDRVDDRCTPDHVWDPLDLEFGFTLDAAASEANAKCDRYYTIEDNGLEQSWAGERVWCNPPFSACRDWVEKASRESAAEVVVMLLPANRTEQGWWQEHVEPYRDRGGILTTRFIARRINFATPGNPGAKYHSSAPFGCVLLVWNYVAGRSLTPRVILDRRDAPRQGIIATDVQRPSRGLNTE